MERLPSNGHPSASARQIASLTEQLAAQITQTEHLKVILAAFIVQHGGTVVIPVKDLELSYDMKAEQNEDNTAIVWTVTKRPPVVL